MTAYIAAVASTGNKTMRNVIDGIEANALLPSKVLLDDQAGRRCAVSMIALACNDLTQEVIDHPKSRHEKEMMRNRKEAMVWVAQQSDAGEQPILTFLECCDVLGWEPDAIRERLFSDAAGIHARFIGRQTFDTAAPSSEDLGEGFDMDDEETASPVY